MKRLMVVGMIVLAAVSVSGCAAPETNQTLKFVPGPTIHGRWATPNGSDSISFSLNGSVFGSAGCETFTGSFSEAGSKTTVDGVVFDDSRCSGERGSELRDSFASEFTATAPTNDNLSISSQSADVTTKLVRTRLKVSDLRGEWRLVSGHDDTAEIAVDAGHGDKTLSFDDHGVGGSDDCNSFGYTFEGPEEPSIFDWSFPLGSLVSTARGCRPAMGDVPLATTAPSGHYSVALAAVTEASFEGSELVLHGGDSELRFVV